MTAEDAENAEARPTFSRARELRVNRVSSIVILLTAELMKAVSFRGDSAFSAFSAVIPFYGYKRYIIRGNGMHSLIC